ncbi:D-2-hydroxyacid dehydrogenase [Heyndrickxia ginsengihumi]|uniref:D-2-hydroxyacid dehydrogenase n=1 Tax=Heyndrickxia ginsengihumi TaxID=363870 RepID=UPI0020411E05|nr:D-2-hydroxyacid dehydrogenase [Heyndrickxia ginsengihumi]MCM3024483.1 D-2-hydroxyacid dehydrogenase [Heyndrickxia ginsengihumi]
MNISFTFKPPIEMQKELQQSFPDIRFHYFNQIEEGQSIWGEAEVIVTFGEDLTPQHINNAHHLKWIMVVSAGLEKMPLDSIQEQQIMVTNARGIHKKPMAEFTFAYILHHAKGIHNLSLLQNQRVWNHTLKTQEINEQCIMIVGTGAIGQEIARISQAFGMKVIGVNRSGKMVDHVDEVIQLDSLKEALPEADYIVSILPSTKETVHIYQYEHFQKMKESAVFINIGRGDVVEESVLIDALLNQEIAHAYLDVFKKEPLPADHPFWNMKNLTITPHLSSHSEHYLPRAMAIFKENLSSYLQKEEKQQYINVVDIEKGY